MSDALVPFDLEALSTLERIEAAMPALLALPQASEPVFHRFGPGLYVRELHMSAGTLVVGHRHRAPHLNVMLTGRLRLVESGIEGRDMVAPWTFVSQPGRKVAVVVEDTIWQNIVATDETDIEAIEAAMFDKGKAFYADEARRFLADCDRRAEDRIDFAIFQHEGIALPVVDHDERHDPTAPKLTVRKSPIAGRGLFLSAPAVPGEVLAPGPFALRWANHSAKPNAVFAMTPNGDIVLTAIQHIGGCMGGDSGTEITVDYRLVGALAAHVGASA